MTPGISPAIAERSEAEALFDLETATPEPARGELGVAALRIGGGIALSMRNDVTNYWSKTLALGFTEPITASLIGQACDFYREQGTPLSTFPLAPAALPADWQRIREKHALERGSSWSKLAARTDTVLDRARERVHLAEPLRIEPIGPQHAHLWAGTTLDLFGMPRAALIDMLANCVGRDRWHAVGVWDGDRLVAVSVLYAGGDGVAQCSGAATLPGYRGQGAQTAMLAARARAAADAGCRWLVAETPTEESGDHSSSLRNTLRLGFEVQYERPDWIFKTQ
jgi:GNAT superfamily N-acetyltransferase